MGLLTHWALLVLVSCAQLFVGELRGLGLPISISWSMVCPGLGACIYAVCTLAGCQLPPCHTSILPCKEHKT